MPVVALYYSMSIYSYINVPSMHLKACMWLPHSFTHTHRFTASELLKSEKEYVTRLNYAMLHYLPAIFESMVPRALRAQKETLLGNLEDIWEFHSK